MVGWCCMTAPCVGFILVLLVTSTEISTTRDPDVCAELNGPQ